MPILFRFFPKEQHNDQQQLASKALLLLLVNAAFVENG